MATRLEVIEDNLDVYTIDIGYNSLSLRGPKTNGKVDSYFKDAKDIFNSYTFEFMNLSDFHKDMLAKELNMEDIKELISSEAKYTASDISAIIKNFLKHNMPDIPKFSQYRFYHVYPEPTTTRLYDYKALQYLIEDHILNKFTWGSGWSWHINSNDVYVDLKLEETETTFLIIIESIKDGVQEKEVLEFSEEYRRKRKRSNGV